MKKIILSPSRGCRRGAASAAPAAGLVLQAASGRVRKENPEQTGF